MMKNGKFFLYIGLYVLSFAYAIWKIYEMAFISNNFEKYGDFAQYIWHSLSDSSNHSKGIALFIYLAVLFIIVYGYYFLNENPLGAALLSILLMLLSSKFDVAFWYLFLGFTLLPVIGILFLFSIGFVVLDFLSLDNITTAIIVISQIIFVPLSMCWSVLALSTPLQFLSSLFSGDSSSEVSVSHINSSEHDYMADAQRDRMEEHLRNIDWELRNKR